MFKIKMLALIVISAILSSVAVSATSLENRALGEYLNIDNIINIPQNNTNVNVYSEDNLVPKKVEPATVPEAPANLYLAHATSTYALIAWDAPAALPGETLTGYKVGISADGTNYQYFTVTDEYIFVEGFTQDHMYWVTVQAQNGSGYSASTESTFMTPLVDSIPTDVLLPMSGTPTDTSINMSWSIPQKSGTALTNYVIAYSKDNATWTTVTVPYNFITRESYDLTGLQKGTDYYIKIAAVNSSGQGWWSSTITAKTSGSPSTVPAQPTSLGVTSYNQSSVTLAWYAPADNGGENVVDYIIQYKSAGSAIWLNFTDTISSATTVKITNLYGSTKYNFRVAAVNSVGTSDFSLPITQSTAIKTVPDAPTGLKLVEGYKTSFQVGWSAPENNGGSSVKDYIIQYKLTTSSTWITLNDGVSTSTKALISGVLAYKTYHYRVAAVNNVGQSVFSSTNYMVMSPPAMPLTSTIQLVTDDSVTIALSHVFNIYKPTVRDTIVQYRKTGTSTWLTYADGSGVSNTVTVSGLLPSTSYEFRVASANNTGWGVFSTTMTATTKTPITSDPISGLTLTSKTKTSALITWTASPSTNIADYVIEYSTDGATWNVYDDGVSVSPVALITGLTSNTGYSFRVATMVSGVKSTYVTTDNIFTLSGNSTPLSVSGLNVISYTSTTANLTWNQTENFDSKITGYQIGVSTDGTNFSYALASVTAGNATITAMSPNTKYWVTVQAINGNGLGLVSGTTLTTNP